MALRTAVIPPSAGTAWARCAGDSAGGVAHGAVTPTLVGTIVPRDILHDDEEILILIKPSVLFIFYSSLPFLACLLMLGIALAQVAAYGWSSTFTPGAVAVATAIACLGRLVWGLLVWTSHIYMLTNLRVVTIKGVINVHIFQTQLRRIQKTELYRPLGQRVLATATVGFSTAAAAGRPDSTWVMIARPAEIYDHITTAIHRAQSR